MAMRREPLATPWKGVSLGGWLLLEPGPSYPLFENHPNQEGEELRCEWTLLKSMRQMLGKRQAHEVLTQHRETHITKADFQRIRACGLNAVRLPFGYWVVSGPASNEPYFGPALEYIDRAVDWAEECGLQLVLDLHGCPGGESGEAPCGHRQRPAERWHWNQWRNEESLRVLEVLALRYKNRTCVTGIAVCNEPSNTIPWSRLLRYYDRAVDTIRQAGMPASRVSILLPVFQRPEDEFAKRWLKLTGDKHRNICFDVHCYHCFENEFSGKTLAQQMRAVEENAEMLRQYPMVVGEWSLALGVATWCTCGDMEEDEVYAMFGRLQNQAFKEASHGSFFWNWTEADDREWNFQKAHAMGLLSDKPMQLPAWNGQGEDPLEPLFNPVPVGVDSRIFLGDAMHLRVFYGRYIDVDGSHVGARWPDKGIWQELVFCPTAAEASKAGLKVRREIRDGDVVRLRGRNGRFLSVDENGQVIAVRASANASSEFIVHIESGDVLRHRSTIYLRNRATSLFMDADEEEEGLFARFDECGWWQQLSAEKAPQDLVPVTPQKLFKAEEMEAVLALNSIGVVTNSPPKGRRRGFTPASLETSTSKEPAVVLETPPPGRGAALRYRRWVKSPPCATPEALSTLKMAFKTPVKLLAESPKDMKRRSTVALLDFASVQDSPEIQITVPPAKLARVQ